MPVGIFKAGRGRQKPPCGAQVNAGHPLAQSMAGCWLFNEGGGSNALSALRGSDIASGVASPTWGATRAGTAALLDGATQYFAVNSSPAVSSNAAPFTIAVWYAATASIAGGATVYGEGRSSTATPCNFIRLVSGTMQIFWRDDSNNGQTVSDSATTNDGGPHLVVVSSTGATVNLNRDGALRTQAANGLLTAITLDRVALGAISRNTVTSFFGGYLNTVMTWRRALTPTEAAWLYAEPYAMLQPVVRRVYSIPSGVAGNPYYWLLAGRGVNA